MTYKNTLVSEKKTIKDAILNLNSSSLKIVCVIGKNKKLLGTITDGDIRRCMLKKISTSSSVTKIMNRKPNVLMEGKELDKKKVFDKLKLIAIPVVNKKKQIKDIIFDTGKKRINNKFYIIAGGRGSRMMPLTLNLPKPMLMYNGEVIIESIIEKARLSGFNNFYISINYLGEKIKKYLKKYENSGIKINFIVEKKQLGTGGSLSNFYNKKINEPFLVTNADLITNLKYNEILNYHREYEADATVGVKKMIFKNPYGVVETKKIIVKNITEKPSFEFNVNAGIYVFNPKVLNKIKKNTYFDIPDLISQLIKRKKKVIIFPLYEDWKDLQTPKDLSI